mmetsp:Transcript_16838/g.57998  ORF Transcript_16838/g.57998 Transcript_16838/m.57998 type:complete len:229 (+) Transcript_16838:965-1651(+)
MMSSFAMSAFWMSASHSSTLISPSPSASASAMAMVTLAGTRKYCSNLFGVVLRKSATRSSSLMALEISSVANFPEPSTSMSAKTRFASLRSASDARSFSPRISCSRRSMSAFFTVSSFSAFSSTRPRESTTCGPESLASSLALRRSSREPRSLSVDSSSARGRRMDAAPSSFFGGGGLRSSASSARAPDRYSLSMRVSARSLAGTMDSRDGATLAPSLPLARACVNHL